jgi:hypothetical protein
MNEGTGEGFVTGETEEGDTDSVDSCVLACCEAFIFLERAPCFCSNRLMVAC